MDIEDGKFELRKLMLFTLCRVRENARIWEYIYRVPSEPRSKQVESKARKKDGHVCFQEWITGTMSLHILKWKMWQWWCTVICWMMSHWRCHILKCWFSVSLEDVSKTFHFEICTRQYPAIVSVFPSFFRFSSAMLCYMHKLVWLVFWLGSLWH